jgi:multiple sugar transport system substrate-binding protein
MPELFFRFRELRCEQVSDLLTAYLHVGLPPRQQSAVEHHLQGCATCRSELDAARRLEADLRLEAASHQPKISRQASTRIQRNLYQRIRKGLMMRRAYQFATTLAIAAVALLLFVKGDAMLRHAAHPLASHPTEIIFTPVATPSIISELVAEDKKDDVIITFAADAAEQSRYETWMDDFHRQNPAITVKFVDAPTDGGGNAWSYHKALASAADSAIFNSFERRYARVYFKTLQPLMENDPAFAADDFWPRALTACQDANGEIVGLPLTMGLHGIYFDETAFKAARLPLPAPGWTWDDFRRAVTTLGTPQHPAFVNAGYAPYLNILGSLTDSALAANNGERDLATLQSAVEWYLDLTMRQSVAGMPASPDDRQQFFTSGSVPPMWTDYVAAHLPGDETAGSTWETMAAHEYGFAPFPVDADHPQTTPAYAICVGISSGTRYPQETWAWIEFLSHQWTAYEGLGAYSDAEAPARQSVANAVGYWDRLPADIVPAVQYGLAHAWFGPSYPWEFSLVQKALGQSINKRVDFATALTNAETEAAANPEPAPPTGQVSVAKPDESAPDDAVARFTTDDAYSNQEISTFKVLITAYNQAYPDAKIAFVPANPALDPAENAIADMAQRADCIKASSFYGSGEFPDLLSLDALVAAEDPAFLQDYPMMVMNDYRQNGTLYGLPAAIYPTYLYYNKTLLTQRGLEFPTNDWTFDDFIALASAAASTDPDDTSYGYLWLAPTAEFITARAGQWEDWESNPPKIRLDSPEMLNTMLWLKEQVKQNAILPQTLSPDHTQEYFDISMKIPHEMPVALWGSESGIFPIEDGGWRQMDVGVVALPYASSSYWSTSYLISKGAENPQACWNWIKFLSEQPNLYKRSLPARKSVAASLEWETWIGPERAAIYRQAASQLDQDLLPAYAQTNWPIWQTESYLTMAISAILSDDADPQQALAEAQQRADALLACLPADRVYTDAVGRCMEQRAP